MSLIIFLWRFEKPSSLVKNTLLCLNRRDPRESLVSSIKSSLSHIRRFIQLFLLPYDNVRWHILGRCSIHLPSIAISTTLLTLNFSKTFYGHTGAANQNLRFNALQFAAKLHEILIGASLSMIAINYVQFELLSGEGLSHGGILVGFQVPNLSAFWNPVLWSGCLTKGFRTRRIRFLLLIIALVILGSIVGPSSAILMLPTLGWWESSNGALGMPYSGNTTNDTRFLLAENQSTLWPVSITTLNFLPPDCNFTSVTIPKHCPAGGLSLLLDELSSPDDFNRYSASVNITMGGNASGAYNQFLAGTSGCLPGLSRPTLWESDISCWVVQTPSIIIYNMLVSIWDGTSDDMEET